MSRSIASNFLWKLAERLSVQGVQFVVQLVLARLLSPKDYGVLVIVLVFINLSSVFIESGLNTALVQKKDVDERDFSSVFFASLGVCVLAVGVLWACAPLIADFYADARLVTFVRASSFVLLVGVYNSIQVSVMYRRMEFRKSFISSIVGVLASAVVGVWMAVAGFGVWALLANYVVNIVVGTVVLSFIVRWHPHWVFSFARLRPLFRFGYKLLLARVILNLTNDLYSLVIGKKFTKTDLGYYETGNKIPLTSTTALSSSIISVFLPVFSQLQDNPPVLRDLLRRSYKVTSFFVFPLLALLCASSRPLIVYLLTDKWEMAVPYMQIGCVLFAVNPMINCANQAYNALGHSDVFLSIQYKKKIVELLALLATIWISLLWVAIGRMVATVGAMYFVMVPARGLLAYGLRQQARDLWPSVWISCAAALAAACFLPLGLRPLPTLLLQWLTGGAVYLGLSWWGNREMCTYYIGMAKRFTHR